MTDEASFEAEGGSCYDRWPVERAWAWYRKHPWLCGFNYVPSTAINPIELWAVETFDPAAMDRELAWAKKLGFNTLRVNLHYFAWEADPAGLGGRIGQFLDLAARHGLSVVPCLFDDCSHNGRQPHHGRQDDPVPGVHNSGWTPSPGHALVVDEVRWPLLAAYVTEIIEAFWNDPRILMWDLYNEPGNGGLGEKSLPLLRETFNWAREANPAQPITSGVWMGDTAAPAPESINGFLLSQSDVITFHNYSERDPLQAQTRQLKTLGRPVLCTEWLRRPVSGFETHLDVFRDEGVGCFFWGLVNGKSQTQYPWGSPAGAPEPDPWFHDLLRRDGTPYRAEETAHVRDFIAAARRDEAAEKAKRAAKNAKRKAKPPT
jgi:hypothetical protein